MEYFTIDQKIAIIRANKALGEFCDKVEDIPGNREYTIINEWISEVLGMNFRECIYDNKIINDANRAIGEWFDNKYSMGWHLGDAMFDTIYRLTSYDYNIDNLDNLIESAELRITTIYEDFIHKAGLDNKRVTEYVDSGLVINGKKVYYKKEDKQ